MVEAIAKFNFVASSEDELSFRKGDQLIVFRRAEENWYSAALHDKSGLVPMNYVTVKPAPFLQQVSREGAVRMLTNQRDGAYIIRKSESDPNHEHSYSLSVKYGDGVQHFKILTDVSYKFFLWVVKFSSLNELVDYYKTSSVSRTQNILLKDPEFKDNPEAMPVFNDEMEYARAKFDFNGEEEGEISFRIGDEIEIIKKIDKNWWEGRLKPKPGENVGMRGLFPASYVKVIK